MTTEVVTTGDAAPRPRGLRKWFAGVLAFLALAILLKLSLLIYSMYVLLALLVISRYLAGAWVGGLSATRECNRLSVQIGDKVAVNVTAKNGGAWPVPWVLMEDLLPRSAIVQRPPRLRVTGKRLLLARLAKGERKSINYMLQFEMRGYYQIGPLMMETGDVFGLHRRIAVTADPHYVLVYPKIVPLDGYDLASRRPIGEIRLAHRLYEDPTRIAGVRQYQSGDPMQRVHWRATARTGVLHSKVYEPSAVAGATILLDLHRDAWPTRNEPARSELAITTAASLANAVYELGQQIGLATNGRDAVDRIRQESREREFKNREAARETGTMQEENDRLSPLIVPTRRGPEQLNRILQTLARAELTDGLDFPALVLEAANRLPRDATVVAVLPDATPTAAMALGSLRRRGFAVTAVVVAFDDVEFRDAAGRLSCEGVEARQVLDEASLSALCRRNLVRSL